MDETLSLEKMDIATVLKRFAPISLDDMNGVSLMNRIDTKFIAPAGLLPVILEQMSTHYKILEIETNRLFQYKTEYYDTKDFGMYEAHQNGKLNRFKVRKREYVASGQHFLEVKFKNNKRRTIKKRIEKEEANSINKMEMSFIEENSPYKTDELELKLSNQFNRVTLVGETERLTIDFKLSFFDNTGNNVNYPEAVIIELKQEHFSASSFGMQILRKHKIQPESCSKYCLGAASLNSHIKSNRLKKKFGMIQKFKSSNKQ